jgi:hypothetical protein
MRGVLNYKVEECFANFETNPRGTSRTSPRAAWKLDKHIILVPVIFEDHFDAEKKMRQGKVRGPYGLLIRLKSARERRCQCEASLFTVRG